MSSKDLKQICADAERKGWTVKPTNGGHLKWVHTSGAVMFSAQTPSDHRAIKNIESRIRRVEQGLPVRG